MDVRGSYPNYRGCWKGGEPAYRLGQAYSALTGSLVRDWEEATSLPQSLRETLNEEAPAAVLDLRRTWRATDGTRKYLFYTHDAHAIETVMIPEKGRHTVCISTQVGCPMACKFCATGLLGIKRNLKVREIAEQVFVASRDIAPERVSNVVVMGMGEPMLNYNATLGGVEGLERSRRLRACGEAYRGLYERVGGQDPAFRGRAGAVPSGDLLAHPLRGGAAGDHARRRPPYHPRADGRRPLLRDADAPQALLRVHPSRRRQRPAATRRGPG